MLFISIYMQWIWKSEEKRGREEDLNECAEGCESKEKVSAVKDMNARVVNRAVGNILKYRE